VIPLHGKGQSVVPVDVAQNDPGGDCQHYNSSSTDEHQVKDSGPETRKEDNGQPADCRTPGNPTNRESKGITLFEREYPGDEGKEMGGNCECPEVKARFLIKPNFDRERGQEKGARNDRDDPILEPSFWNTAALFE
jgi:hypothetical protein